MRIGARKRLVASLSNASKKRVKFDTSRLEEIKESITKRDLRSLIKDKAIKIKPKRGVSRVRARLHDEQKRKGRRKGSGSRKGTRTARLPRKDAWVTKIRVQRKFLMELRSKGYLTPNTYRNLYKMAKGGTFRSKRHIQLYIKDNNMAVQKDGKK
tara:strand:+ start:1528 stop:1992 length:465 start_codon:yes stop_codon:yes gene_type:complete